MSVRQIAAAVLAACALAAVAFGGEARPAGPTGCERVSLRSAPSALAWIGGRIAVASGAARSVSIVDLGACRGVGSAIRLPRRAPVSPSGPQPGWVWAPDSPGPLAADRSRLWIAGEFSLYRADLKTRKIVRTVRMFRRERRNGRTYRVPIGFLGMTLEGRALWLANLVEGPTFLYRLDAVTGRVELKRSADTEIVGMASGGGSVWAISHDRGTLLQIDPRTGDFVRTDLGGDPHGVAFGAGHVWVAMYHDDEILRADPQSGAIEASISVPFPPEPMAAAGQRLWAIPSTGGYRANPRLRTVLEIDPATGQILRTTSLRGRPRAILARDGEAWVATSQPNELVRLHD